MSAFDVQNYKPNKLLFLVHREDILIKAVDSTSYHAILQELKDKEIYNMIVDIHKTDNMADFLKAVSDFIFLFSFLSMPCHLIKS